MDGVLVDSADAHLRAWQRLGEEVGVPFSKQFFQQTFGQRNASIIPSWLGDVSAARVTELDHRKESLYRQFVRQGAIRIYPGVGGLLDQLRSRGAKAAIATSGPRENATLLPEQAAHFISKAAALYEQEAKSLECASFINHEAFLGSWSGKSIKDWTADVRKRECEILTEACRLENNAITQIEKALSSL